MDGLNFTYGDLLLFVLVCIGALALWLKFRPRGRRINCAWCGKPTRQIDGSALQDSSGICPKCYKKLLEKARR